MLLFCYKYVLIECFIKLHMNRVYILDANERLADYDVFLFWLSDAEIKTSIFYV